MHVLNNGVCVTCNPRLTAKFDVHQPRDHEGKWTDIGGIDVPDLGALHSLDNFDSYDKSYEVHDESPAVAGIAAISMTNGDTQVAYDTDSHRYVLADSDAYGMREFADTLEHMLESHDQTNLDEVDDGEPGDLVDYETWDDGDIRVGFDVAGDFRITSADSGHEVDLPELTAEQVADLIQALRDQADEAEALAE